MELQKIEQLLEKYDNGETSLQEEEQLRQYFLNEEIAEHLKPYQPLFAFFKAARQESYTEKPSQVSRPKYRMWFSTAASIVIIAASVWYVNSTNQKDLGTYDDPQLALQKTKDVLNLVSHYMNEGNDELVYIKELETTKNKLIKDNN